MKIVKKYELMQPKQGETNRLFGVRYLKRHKMRDKRWTAADKMFQYSGLTKLYEKDHALRNITETQERRDKLALVKELREALEGKKNDRLYQTINGDQRIKSIVQNDKFMKFSYPKWDTYKIVERVNDKTFDKRKRLDLIKEHKQKLTDQYEKRVLEVAALQDRIKYQDTLEPKEVGLTRNLEFQLKNSQTRLRTYMTVKRAYRKIIDVMLQDAIFYDSVLDALKEDMTEQEIFIQKTILLGKPALATSIKLQEECTLLEHKTRKEYDIRIRDLLENREKIAENNQKVRILVRRDEDFEIDPSRYDRDTPTITQLKQELEIVEKGIKALKFTSLACEPLDIYPKMREQSRKNVRVVDQINRKEKEKNLAEEKELHAKVIEESLKYDLTDKEIAELGDIDKMEKQIAEEKKKQEECEEKIKTRTDNFILIRMAFQHLVEVLNNVGEAHTAVRQKPQGSMLNLPFLKFDKIYQQYKLPTPVDEDIESLLNVSQKKIETIVKVYQAAKNKEESEDGKILEKRLKDPKLNDKAKEIIKKVQTNKKENQRVRKWKDYHYAILKALTDQESQFAVHEEEMDGQEVEDPSVLSRSQIKALSSKIVSERAKRDD